jgi:ribosomal protein L11 methyltransferase
MSWLTITAHLDEEPPDWSYLVEIFRDHGLENTVQTDRPFTLSAAIVDVAGTDKVAQALKVALLMAGVANVTVEPLEEVNWDEAWKQHFKPRRVGKRFTVCPTWEEAPSDTDLLITLDPGQAFGTGDHPTTRLCLELLESTDIEGLHVADVGCGSGILSVGACLLGAASVAAVDIEDISVEVAKENAERNHVKFHALTGDGLIALEELRPEGGWDVVVSNIISAVIIRIAPDVALDLKSGGTWIVSGVIPQNWPDVQAAAERAGFTFLQSLEEDGWVAATFRL